MKSFLKFMVLLALIIGGKLSKSAGPVAVTAQLKPAATAAIVLASEHVPAVSAPTEPRSATEPARPQVLSVFFK